MKKKAFTLIELIAVLVVLAILALIVTPLVMNIIRKIRIAADRRSIDAYGRSIELAIATFLLDEGRFPTSISDLTIEYTGDEVICSTTQLNSDSSVYLAGCTVAGRSIDYTYGIDKSPTYTAYSVGDEITYNGVDYYVIKDSSIKDATVTLLKAEPLSVEEVNLYGGVGAENNHVNQYTSTIQGTAKDQNGYGAMAYYSSETCSSYENSNGCSTDYESSDIKYVVDAWSNSKVPDGLEIARLLKKEEYDVWLIAETYETPTSPGTRYNPVFEWQFNQNYSYWLMGPYCCGDFIDAYRTINVVDGGGGSSTNWIYLSNEVVRPVIVLSKTVLN